METWLALDIGNSVTKGGFFEDGALRRTFRLKGGRKAPGEAWRRGLLAELELEGAAPGRIGIASVVPEATAAAQALLKEATGCPPEVLHHALRLPFRLAYETPQTLGADRLAAAAAAWMHFNGDLDTGNPTATQRSVVAVDVGTAVSYEVIDRGGVYRGGAIGPGPHLMQRALRRGTAQLPEAPLRLPPSPVGASTQEALQSGILYGFVDSVCGMIDRIRHTLRDAPAVVATGGGSALLSRHGDAVDAVEPHLVLHGIRLLMEMNGKGGMGERVRG